VPVLLAWWGVNNLAGAGHDDFPVPGPYQRCSLGDVEGLAQCVGVPGGAGTGGEVNAIAGHPGRLGLAHVNRVDIRVAGEQLRGPVPGRLPSARCSCPVSGPGAVKEERDDCADVGPSLPGRESRVRRQAGAPRVCP